MAIKNVEPKYEVSVRRIYFKKNTSKVRSFYCETYEDASNFFTMIYDSILPTIYEDHDERHVRFDDYRLLWLKDEEELIILELQKIVSD